jgi:CRP/FNR family transcriptional regulator, cyclic AMP receptor protein
MENTEYLKTIFVFRELTSMELIKVNKVLKTLKVARGAEIIREGEIGDVMFIIKKGAVDIYKGKDLGKKKITHLLPGSHFGEISLIDDNPRSASVVALEDCELLTIKRAEFEGILNQNEGIALKVYKAFTRALCDRLRLANENLIVAHEMNT